MNIRAYQVWITGREENASVINAETIGKAKAEYFHEVLDCLPDLKFTSLRCRMVGAPVTDESFRRTARNRGLPSLLCGDRVRVNGCEGVVVKNNPSANFDVVFESGRYAGRRLSVHPSEMEILSGFQALKGEQ